jgi:hypothetical protein
MYIIFVSWWRRVPAGDRFTCGVSVPAHVTQPTRAFMRRYWYRFSIIRLPKVESRPEFAQDHESGLRSDRGPVFLCEFSKLRFWKSPYDFLNLCGRFCPYNPPYNPGPDTLPPKMGVEIFTQRKKPWLKSIECVHWISNFFLKNWKSSSKFTVLNGYLVTF